jgi:hypothetical protein
VKSPEPGAKKGIGSDAIKLEDIDGTLENDLFIMLFTDIAGDDIGR